MQPASDGIVTPREGRAGGRGRSWAEDRACIAAFSPDSAHSWHFTSTDNTPLPSSSLTGVPRMFHPSRAPPQGSWRCGQTQAPSSCLHMDLRSHEFNTDCPSSHQRDSLGSWMEPNTPVLTSLSARSNRGQCSSSAQEPQGASPHQSDPARYSSRGIPQEQ